MPIVADPRLEGTAVAAAMLVAKAMAKADTGPVSEWKSTPVTVVFLDLNGLHPELSDGEAFDLVWEIASTSFDVDAIAIRLKLTS